MQKHPDELLPQVATALGFATASPELPAEYVGDDARIRYLFGEDARQAVEILINPFKVDPELNLAVFQLDFSLVAGRAQRWLELQSLKDQKTENNAKDGQQPQM
jgi:hypothetical protein